MNMKSFDPEQSLILYTEAIKKHGCAIRYVPKNLINYKMALSAVQHTGRALQYLDPVYRDNYDIVHEAVKKKGSMLQYASERLKENQNIVEAAITSNGISLRYASSEFKKNMDICRRAIQQCGKAFQYVSSDLHSDKKLVIQAMLKSGKNLKYVKNDIKYDINVVRIAFYRYPFIFRDQENTLSDVFKYIAKQNGIHFWYFGLYDRFFVELLPFCRTSVERKEEIQKYIHFFIVKLKYLYHRPRFYFVGAKKYHELFYHIYDRIPKNYELDREMQLISKLFIKKRIVFYGRPKISHVV